MSPLESLKAGFRRACVRRLVGDEEGAVNVLKSEIPGLVVNWAKTSSLEASEKKAKLKELFDDESARADELSTAFDLFAGRFEARVAQQVRDEVSSLTSRFEELMEGVKKSLEANRLSVGNAQPSIQPENPSPGSVSDQDSLITDVIDAASNDEMISSPNKEKKVESIPESEVPTDVDLISEPFDSMPEGEKNDLPPTGIGLKFDEIEEMIDEILSF